MGLLIYTVTEKIGDFFRRFFYSGIPVALQVGLAVLVVVGLVLAIFVLGIFAVLDALSGQFRLGILIPLVLLITVAVIMILISNKK